MQIESSRKLGLSASQTMRTAQRLYEGTDIKGETTGLITYMRTDSVVMSKEAINQVRGFVTDNYVQTIYQKRQEFINLRLKMPKKHMNVLDQQIFT